MIQQTQDILDRLRIDTETNPELVKKIDNAERLARQMGMSGASLHMLIPLIVSFETDGDESPKQSTPKKQPTRKVATTE